MKQDESLNPLNQVNCLNDALTGAFGSWTRMGLNPLNQVNCLNNMAGVSENVKTLSLNPLNQVNCLNTGYCKCLYYNGLQGRFREPP